MSDEHRGFWAEYYKEIVERKTPWLDYSNERVQAQTFALCLEAAGPIGSRRCLDLGCGWGQFSRLLAALEAAAVTGVDFQEELIASHRAKHPQVRWLAGNVLEANFRKELGGFDLVFLIEVLQYLPLAEAVSALWAPLAPGGRMVAMVPNRECPIIRGAIARFEGRYAPPDPAELAAVFESLPELAFWSHRGLFFQEDQRHLPYEVSPWTRDTAWSAPPNRLLVVAEKAAEEDPQSVRR